MNYTIYTHKSTISTLALKLSVSAIIYPRWTATLCVCEAYVDNRADVVDQLLIVVSYSFMIFLLKTLKNFHLLQSIHFVRWGRLEGIEIRRFVVQFSSKI